MHSFIAVSITLFTAAPSFADDTALFTSGVMHPQTAPAFASIATGWDGARHAAILQLDGELAIAGPLRAVVRIAGAKPGAGIGVQCLDEDHHGMSVTAYLLAKAEGFTEPEGELEAALALGRHVDRVYLAFALTYGQDPDAKERDGELAISAGAPLAPAWLVGVVARGRDALGSAGDRDGVVRDGFAGFSATYVTGPLGITASAGGAAVGIRNMPLATGLAGTIALGSAF